MPEEEKEIECYTDWVKKERHFDEECEQCIFEALCLAWDSKHQWSDTHEAEKTL